MKFSPHLVITRTIWSEWTQALWPPLSLLSFDFLWPPLIKSSLLPDCSGKPPDLSGLDPDSPPRLAVKFPLSVFLGQLTYIICCALLYILQSCSQEHFFLYYKYSIWVWQQQSNQQHSKEYLIPQPTELQLSLHSRSFSFPFFVLSNHAVQTLVSVLTSVYSFVQ